MDIARIHLDGNADAVEFCPEHPYQHILAAATYTLKENCIPSRDGSLSLISIHDPTGLKLLQSTETSGIFDIKWRTGTTTGEPCLIQADSDGFLTIYCLESPATADEYEAEARQDARIKKLQSEKISCSAMCLNVDWQGKNTGSLPGVAVGLSDGTISLASLSQSKMQLETSWHAHEFEIWAIAYDDHQNNVLYSGADDCNLCGWDVREDPSQPIFRNSKGHKMGICSIQKCPENENLVITGSYDEFLRIWDTRMLERPVLQDSLGLGGGVWKLKFHPTERNVVLAACMHNGFAIVKLDDVHIKCLEEYKGHSSLAYGCDWFRGDVSKVVEEKWEDCYQTSHLNTTNHEVFLHNISSKPSINVQCHRERKLRANISSKSALVATCSFYDQALHLWLPKSFMDTN